MKMKKSTRLYIMIALISALSSISTACVIEYLRTPPTAAFAEMYGYDLSGIERRLDSIVSAIHAVASKMR